MSPRCFVVLALLALSTSLPRESSAEPTAVAALLTIYDGGRQVYEGINLLTVFKGELWHEWTMCEYRSGFRIYNRFKSKRLRNGGLEIINYYRYWGDGHSFYGACDGNEHHVDLPSDREDIERIHGPIRRIALLRDPPSCQRDNIIDYVDRWDASKGWRITCD